MIMDSTYIAAVAALAGSAIGGLTSLASAWLTQDRQVRAQWVAKDKSERQELYKQFIEEASRLYADALTHNQSEVSSLVSVYTLISRMRVLSSDAIVEKAEEVARMIIDTFSLPNKTFTELRQMIDSHTMDPLREFSEACGEELRKFRPS